MNRVMEIRKVKDRMWVKDSCNLKKMIRIKTCLEGNI